MTITESNKEITKSTGIQEEIKNSIKEAEQELSKPIYINATKKYKDKFLELKILEHAIEDLSGFIKAVDWSMLQYHKEKMVYINQTIRELWSAVYRGNDIDYIELCTDSLDAPRKSDRRTFTYRLVQVKNDVKLEMRGRCSAGQRVLASLIIRIALADTFSSKCGILALDEPTTNLDKDNIDSLCRALADLIERKRTQKNFQLLIITHDQIFLEKLRMSMTIDQFYLVSRNSEGKSVLTVKDAVF